MIAPAVAEDADIDPLLPSGLECLVIVARQHGLDLTSTQLIKDNLLTEGEVSPSQLVRCDRSMLNSTGTGFLI
jgi:ATP-binding cassette subfamily B protein